MRLLLKPVLGDESGDSSEVTCVAGYQEATMRECDGGNSQIGLGQGRSLAFEFSPEHTVASCCWCIEWGNRQVGKEIALDPLP